MVLQSPQRQLVSCDVQEPTVGRGQLLVRVAACAVCRTDLHVIDGELPNPKLPLIPGHEIVGHVEKLGEDVSGFSVGERIGIPWLGWTCGECKFCRSNRENLASAPCSPATRSTAVMPNSRWRTRASVFAFQPCTDDVAAAPLLCAGLIGYRSLRMAGDAERIGIYGFGAAAHIVTQVARYQGRKTFAFTRPGDETAQRFALAMGADWAGGCEAAPEKLEAAIIFAPVGALVPAALRTLERGGIVVCGGIHMSDIPSFPYADLWQERKICSVANLTRRDAIEFLEIAPRIPVTTETHLYPLARANEALEALRSGKLTGAAVLGLPPPMISCWRGGLPGGAAVWQADLPRHLAQILPAATCIFHCDGWVGLAAISRISAPWRSLCLAIRRASETFAQGMARLHGGINILNSARANIRVPMVIDPLFDARRHRLFPVSIASCSAHSRSPSGRVPRELEIGAAGLGSAARSPSRRVFRAPRLGICQNFLRATGKHCPSQASRPPRLQSIFPNQRPPGHTRPTRRAYCLDT